MIVRFCPSTRTTSSSPIFFSETSPLLGEGQVEPQTGGVVADHELLGERAVQHRGRVAVGEQRVGEAVEHRRPDHLGLEVRRAQHRDRGERGLDQLEVLLLALAPGPK